MQGEKNIDRRVLDNIADEIQLDSPELGNDLYLDIKADSFDIIKLFMSFEKIFDIEISDSDSSELRTLQEISDFIFDSLDNEKRYSLLGKVDLPPINEQLSSSNKNSKILHERVLNSDLVIQCLKNFEIGENTEVLKDSSI